MALTTCQVAVTFAGPLSPAKPWRFIATLPRAQARGPKKAPLQPLQAEQWSVVSSMKVSRRQMQTEKSWSTGQLCDGQNPG